MESRIAQACRLKYKPVALMWTDEVPDGAARFKEGKWGCVMWMLANAARGETAAFDEGSYGCWGGGVGLGFGNQYVAFPGGEPCFHLFLSTGNERDVQGEAVARGMEGRAGKEFIEEFLHGEGYLKSPELVRRFIEDLPIVKIPSRYVVFKPLDEVDGSREQPVVVVFWVDPDQLAALVVLANYGTEGDENVIVPFAAGCQSIGIYAYREARADRPRAVIGQMDLSARLNIAKMLDTGLFTFAVPWRRFVEMEGDVEGSFLQRTTWRRLRGDSQSLP